MLERTKQTLVSIGTYIKGVFIWIRRQFKRDIENEK